MKTPNIFLSGAAMTLLLAACSDEGSPVEDSMVTVAGVVRNVDNGSFASGVRVRLWGTKYGDDVATGSDGAYELKIPRGSKLILATDDFDSAKDAWFPLINCDFTPVYANNDMVAWPIHSCANTAGADSGSVAVWNRYLVDCDDANGDMFQPHSCTDAGGILAIVALQCSFEGWDSLTFAVDTPEGRIGFWNVSAVCVAADGGSPKFCAGKECQFFHPATVTQTDGTGILTGFFDPTFPGSKTTVTATDNNLSRNIVLPPPVEVPIAKGTITLLATGVMNNKLVNFLQMGKHCGWF